MRFLLWQVLLTLLLSGSAVKAQYRVEVVVTNVNDTTGSVIVALFANRESFLKKPLVGKVVKAVSGSMTVVLENVPEGDCAVSIIHDANKNGKLDANFMGIPKEGFGFSNDAMGTMGPPSFDKAKISVQGSKSIRINTRYY